MSPENREKRRKKRQREYAEWRAKKVARMAANNPSRRYWTSTFPVEEYGTLPNGKGKGKRV